VRGLGPGTVLAGRYTVQRRLEQVRETERWTADDTTLGRSVLVLCIAADDHRTAALLDAARRAASVTHTVFVRILDVGIDGDVAYVVEEQLGEAQSLAELVTEGGVPGDEVRRITGEVAAALESARQRGMHHLDLKPEDVLRTPEGDIRLRGLETAAVRVDEEVADAEDAARRDAVGVVALAYAGLTGLWPLGAGGSGLGAAPRVSGGVAAPSEIAAGVPRDLDAICRLTINDDQGPTSPGDYARQVAPWPSRQVLGRPLSRPVALAATAPDVVPSDVTRRPDAGTPDAGTPDAGTPDAGSARVGAAAALPAGDVTDDREAADDTGDHTVVLPNVAAGATAVGAAALAPRVSGDAPTSDAATTRDLPTWTHDDAEHEPTRVLTAPGHGDPPARPADRHGTTERDDDAEDIDDDRSRAGAAVAGAGAAVAGALGTVGGRVGGLARRAVDKVSELSPDTTGGSRPADGDLEAPAPLVPAEPLTKDESKLALGIVAGFLVLALIIGIWGVSRIGSNTDLDSGPAARPATRTTTVAPSSAAPSQSGATSAAPSGGTAEPLAILKVEAYDPEGDGAENNKLTPKTYDGDPSTGWFSENYRTDQFGGLKKGLGIVVDLGPNKKPQAVQLVIPVACDIEVYVGPDNRLEGATKIGEQAGAQGTVSFPVPADVSGQYVVVWYTKLNADGNGKRRAWLNEVVVTG